ncbi:aminotransferase class IV [Endothiovibrio diazotrophicus]
MTAPIYWLNGRIRPAAEAVLPLNDHGLLYGDGVFEGIRFYHRRPFRLTAHLERLEASARALLLELPYDRAALERAVTETIAAFDGSDGYLRLVATRGAGTLGLDPAGCAAPNLFLIADRVAVVGAGRRETGIELITASTRRPGPTVLDPRIKSLNYLNNILAKLEARRAGADEALLLNQHGYLTEGTAENLFLARGAILYTPPVSDGALDGITRAVVLELCAREGIEACERSLTPYDLYTADECFLCGTGAELIPVRAADGRPLTAAPGPLYRRLETAFRALIDEESTR